MANPPFSVGLRRIFMLDTKRIRVLHTTTLLHKWYDLLRGEDTSERSLGSPPVPTGRGSNQLII
jgi:hypothetical protein